MVQHPRPSLYLFDHFAGENITLWVAQYSIDKYHLIKPKIQVAILITPLSSKMLFDDA